MTETKRTRLNLSIDNDIYVFIKKYSSVTQKPISRIFEESMGNLRMNVELSKPGGWFDSHIEPIKNGLDLDLESEKEHMLIKLAAVFNDHPDTISEQQKRDILKHFEASSEKTARDKRREEFIERWEKIFNE